MMKSKLILSMLRHLRGMGHRMIERTWRLGAGARLFFLAIVYSGESFKRFHLTLREIYFTGVMSLLIIIVSAFFVGMVLALQGYNTLQKYGSSEAIGVLVALALVRELGPVVTALLFAGRAGTAITAEIGLMKTTEQLSAMEMMAVNPIARVVARLTPSAVGGASNPSNTAIMVQTTQKNRLLITPLTMSALKSTLACICDQNAPSSTPINGTATK